MEESDNQLLIEKLEELNYLEITKMKILTAVFVKTCQGIVNQKVEMLEAMFREQAVFYGQDLKEYQEFFGNIVTQYKEQLMQVVGQYNQLFINEQLEFQEAVCNQKIAITNFKKSSDIKAKVKPSLVQKYIDKMDACLQKKENYDEIIRECEKELEACATEVEKKINTLFSDKNAAIALQKTGNFARFLGRLQNIISGKNKFRKYCLEPIQVELEMMENRLPNVLQEIRKETIYFVAKIKQAKEETNHLFENSKQET